MFQQKVDLKAKGLYTFPNALGSVPQGALQQADDVIINKDDTIESRRGFNFYGSAMGASASTDRACQLWSYKDVIFRHWGAGAGTTIDYDNGSGTFTSFNGTFSPVTNSIRIKYAEANGNLYFTTSTGIKKISISNSSQLTVNSVTDAGIPQGLNLNLTLNSQTGFFNQESVVGYRVVWGIKDANQNLVLGPPSNREIIYNPLTPLLSTDFNNLLTTLDTVNVTTGIHFGAYHSTYQVSGSSSTQLRNNLIAVASQLDTDVETFNMAGNVSSVTGTATSGSNQITSITTTGIQVGQLVTGTQVVTTTLTGGTTSTTSSTLTFSAVSGVAVGQIVTCSSQGVLDNTLTTTVTGTSGTTVTISSIPKVAGTFNFSFSNPNPVPSNTTVSSIGVNTVTLSNNLTFTGTYTSGFNFSSIFTVQNTGASTYATTYILGTDPTPIFQLGDVVNVTGVTPSTFNTNTATVQAITTNSLTLTTSTNPGTYASGTASLQRYKYSSITKPLTLSPDPFTNELLSLQTYYDAIVDALQVEPVAIVGYKQILSAVSGSTTSGSPTITISPTGIAVGNYISCNTGGIINNYSKITAVGTSTITINNNASATGSYTFNVFENNNVIFDTHNSTQTATVNLNSPIPQGITTNHLYQVYRTQQLAGSTGISLDSLDPGDDEYLAYEGNPTSTDLTNGYIQIQDITPDSFLGASLYTNANGGSGITAANYAPPLAQDITLYYNYLFFANTISNHSLNITLLGVGSLTNNVSTLTITNGTTSNTYTFTTSAEDPVNKKIHISTLSTPSQQINETARSIVNVINRNSNELVYAFYQSGTTGAPGKILLQSRKLGQAAFYLTVDSAGTGSDFSPALPTLGNSVISDNDVRPNRVYYSTQYEPDSVPIVNYFDVGPRDKKILRIIALRQSLYVIKEEGIYQISGNTAPFVQNLHDNSTILKSADSAAVLNNQIYGLANQGVVVINDTGVNIISRPIEGALVPLNSVQYPNFVSSTFGVGYESDRTYNLWTVTATGDTYATQCFKYNTITEAWTRTTKSATCAVVHSADDKLYVGATDTNFIEQERKNFDRTDYADRQYDFTLGGQSILGTQIILGILTNVTTGDVLLQTQYLTIDQYNQLLSHLSGDTGLTSNYLSLTVSQGADLRAAVTSLAQMLDADSGTQTKTYTSGISGYTNSFPDTQSAFNSIVNKLNSDGGTHLKNYTTSSGTVQYEAYIVSTNTAVNSVTTDYVFPFIQGIITVYNHINCVVKWAPESFGDPSMSKQVSEATLIFQKMSFSDASLSFDTDLNPGTISQDFPGLGNGSYGSGSFGNTVYGDSGNAAPLRTYVPRDMQRCRYMNLGFTHSVAREIFSVYGLSLTFNPVSQRAWR